MTYSLFVEVEDNANCEYMPLQVFEAKNQEVSITKVRIHDPDRPHGVYYVTGWTSDNNGSPCPALYVPISDSGQAEGYFVLGGDWGVRMKPIDSGEQWDIASINQWGEPFLVFSDLSDVILD